MTDKYPPRPNIPGFRLPSQGENAGYQKISEGYDRKGGINPLQSRVTIRPPAPAPMRVQPKPPGK